MNVAQCRRGVHRHSVVPPTSRLRSALLLKTIRRIRRSIFRSRPPELRCIAVFPRRPRKKARAGRCPSATPSRTRDKVQRPSPRRDIVTSREPCDRRAVAGHVYTVVRIFEPCAVTDQAAVKPRAGRFFDREPRASLTRLPFGVHAERQEARACVIAPTRGPWNPPKGVSPLRMLTRARNRRDYREPPNRVDDPRGEAGGRRGNGSVRVETELVQ